MEHLFTPYVDMIKIMLEQSERVVGIDYDGATQEEIEEDEVSLHGISVIQFRNYSSEIYLKTFCLLQNNFKVKGEALYYQTI